MQVTAKSCAVEEHYDVFVIMVCVFSLFSFIAPLSCIFELEKFEC